MEDESDKRKLAKAVGFAGLASLASDVSLPPPASAKPHQPDPSFSAARGSAPSPPPTSPPSKPPRQPIFHREDKPTKNGPNALVVVGLVVACFIGFMIFFSESTPPARVEEPAAMAAAEAPGAKPAPAYDPSSPPLAAPERPTEVIPPTGENLVLSMPQLRYCAAEEIRLDGAHAVIDADRNSTSVDRFNGMIGDFNSRCGSFRFSTGEWPAAKQEMEPWRQVLMGEGRARFPQATTSSSADEDDAATAQPITTEERDSIESACSSDRYTRDAGAHARCVQRQLAALGGKSGRPDLSAVSREERASIENACTSDRLMNGAAAYNKCLKSQLSQLASAPGRPDMAVLSKPEQDSIENACLTDRLMNGAASYNRCLTRQMALLGGVSSRPDMGFMTREERDSIESACSRQRLIEGAASYNRCLKDQVVALGGTSGRPDLSQLTFDVRDRLERLCSTDRVMNGASAYNTCLKRELARVSN